tara:strand:+ start:1209 stop:1427 length:219 start_codon:yes stop_codon:yes gene_type:complete
MKVNKITKAYRPMREFGKLLKDIFSPKESSHFWIKVSKEFNTKKEKEEFIYKTIEFLSNETKVNKNYYNLKQ